MSCLKEAFAFLESKTELKTEMALVKKKLIRGSAAFSVSESQSRNLDKACSLHFVEVRGETADTGGLTPRTVAFIRLTAKWMFGKCVCIDIYLQPTNSLTILLLRPESTSCLEHKLDRVCQTCLKFPKSTRSCHSINQQFDIIGSLVLRRAPWLK